MERIQVQAEQLAIKFIEENDQWENLSSEVKEKITDLVSQIFIDWIKPIHGTEKGNSNG